MTIYVVLVGEMWNGGSTLHVGLDHDEAWKIYQDAELFGSTFVQFERWMNGQRVSVDRRKD